MYEEWINNSKALLCSCLNYNIPGFMRELLPVHGIEACKLLIALTSMDGNLRENSCGYTILYHPSNSRNEICS